MSVGYAKLELSTKGNKMDKVETLGTRDLVELVKAKTGLTDIGGYSYALTLAWELADNKLKAKIVRLIEEDN
jgi:hypothetical protein